MDQVIIKFEENDSFVDKLRDNDSALNKFFEYYPFSEKSFEKRIALSNNGREKELSQIIRSYMSDLKLTPQQEDNLNKLADGAKVVVGGQQAGLFGGPLYTFHKILSIVNLTYQLRDKYKQDFVPVFWIAGEDHDFDEVNHTYVFNSKEANLKKIKYHTMTPPESNVSRYTPDKDAMYDALDNFFKELNETVHTKEVYQMCRDIIDDYDSWSDIFRALVHEVFKDYGVLLIDAQYNQLRRLEKPLLKNIIKNHQDIDQRFRKTQEQVTQIGLDPMIFTDTNVHLFLHEDNMRQLLIKDNDTFKLSKTEHEYTEEELLSIVDEEPERFSNNVVTRPVTEEWLFNTVAFIGGPSEIKYWAELNEVFKTLNVQMPIVLPRMKITYLYERVNKLLAQYDLEVDNVITHGIDEERQKFVRAKASETMLEKINELKQIHEKMYKELKSQVGDNQNNLNLVKKNNEIHLNQLDYLEKRYLLNIERENTISMKHFKEIELSLHPMGGLQERIWNPIQIMNDFGKNVFSPSTYPPLYYTLEHMIIKP